MAENANDGQKGFITLKDLKLVYRVTFDARNKWQNILLALDVSKATIESIGVTCRGNPEDCYREGLTEWLKGEAERSWRDLAEALSDPTVGHIDIARAIEREYSSDRSYTYDEMGNGLYPQSGERCYCKLHTD